MNELIKNDFIMHKHSIIRCIIAFLAMILSVLFVFSCSKNDQESNGDNAIKNKIKIVTTIYPEYDWVKNIIKTNEDTFDVSILMTSGIDLHNFQPSAKDILDIGKADLFIYVGGESDKWVDRAINQVTNPNFEAINLMEVLKDSIKIEELKEGMEEEEEHEEHEDGEHEEVEYDEHIWLSLRNAMKACMVIKDKISKLDDENSQLYSTNLNNYMVELTKLDMEYQRVIALSERKTIIFGDRFPFRYMFDDYGLDYYAAFKGCAAETEASFKTIKFLSDKLSEEKLPYVMKIERSDDKISKAIIENSDYKDAEIETMYSIQSVNNEDIKNGETYLTYMQKNLEVLNKVLN